MFVENYRLDAMLGGQAQTAIPYPRISDEDWQKWKAFLPVKSVPFGKKVLLRKTKIFPITHTLVVRQSLFDEKPWIVSSLLEAFTDAEEVCRKSYDYAKRSAFPSAVLILEEEEEIFGENPWAHGLTQENQVVLDKFVQYAEEQGYIPCRPKLSDLFAPVGR